IGEGDGDGNRSENLFLDDRHVRGGVGEDGGFDVVAGIAPPLAVDDGFGAVGFALIQVSDHAVELFFGYQRGDVRCRICAGADVEVLDCFHQCGVELGVNVFVNVDSGAGFTGLARVEGESLESTGNRTGNVGVCEDDVW